MHSKIHNIALSFHGLNDVGAGQKSIEGFFEAGGENGSGGGGGSGEVGMGKKRTRDVMTNDDYDETKFSFVCDQCRKTIRLASSVIHSFTKDGGDYGAVPDESDRQRLIDNLRAEHADYHFAKSLAHTISDTEDAAPPITKKKKTSGTGKDRKKKEVPKGIAKYFTAGAGSSNGNGKGK